MSYKGQLPIAEFVTFVLFLVKKKKLFVSGAPSFLVCSGAFCYCEVSRSYCWLRGDRKFSSLLGIFSASILLNTTISSMEPALDVMSRALQGDPGARSFLERTTSIYVLDVTDTANPKTYGCWNFIHQAMNEVERFESSTHGSRSTGGVPTLVGHVRLLTSMALRVARRSPTKDKALVATCIANASHGSTTDAQSQWLMNLNLELREIVMGRIAAMAFDFSFHRRVGPNGLSSFADRVVMDTLCAILSANAVASGPHAIKHFATEWVIPSSRNLPAFAVASVVLHLALEGLRKTSQAGTKDTLQQLSSPVIAIVLIPTLADAITESTGEETADIAQHQESARTATMCLRALKAWCVTTDLSLPQINHICTKVNVSNIPYKQTEHHG